MLKNSLFNLPSILFRHLLQKITSFLNLSSLNHHQLSKNNSNLNMNNNNINNNKSFKQKNKSIDNLHPQFLKK